MNLDKSMEPEQPTSVENSNPLNAILRALVQSKVPVPQDQEVKEK